MYKSFVLSHTLFDRKESILGLFCQLEIMIKVFQIMNQNILQFHRKARRGEIYSEFHYLTGEISVR